MFRRITLLIFTLLIFSLVVSAESGFINDPNVEFDANACFEGGTLEGKCFKEIEWKCGWYRIRVEYHIWEFFEVPGWVNS